MNELAQPSAGDQQLFDTTGDTFGWPAADLPKELDLSFIDEDLSPAAPTHPAGVRAVEPEPIVPTAVVNGEDTGPAPKRPRLNAAPISSFPSPAVEQPTTSAPAKAPSDNIWGCIVGSVLVPGAWDSVCYVAGGPTQRTVRLGTYAHADEARRAVSTGIQWMKTQTPEQIERAAAATAANPSFSALAPAPAAPAANPLAMGILSQLNGQLPYLQQLASSLTSLSPLLSPLLTGVLANVAAPLRALPPHHRPPAAHPQPQQTRAQPTPVARPPPAPVQRRAPKGRPPPPAPPARPPAASAKPLAAPAPAPMRPGPQPPQAPKQPVPAQLARPAPFSAPPAPMPAGARLPAAPIATLPPQAPAPVAAPAVPAPPAAARVPAAAAAAVPAAAAAPAVPAVAGTVVPPAAFPGPFSPQAESPAGSPSVAAGCGATSPAPSAGCGPEAELLPECLASDVPPCLEEGPGEGPDCGFCFELDVGALDIIDQLSALSPASTTLSDVPSPASDASLPAERAGALHA